MPGAIDGLQFGYFNCFRDFHLRRCHSSAPIRTGQIVDSTRQATRSDLVRNPCPVSRWWCHDSCDGQLAWRWTTRRGETRLDREAAHLVDAAEV